MDDELLKIYSLMKTAEDQLAALKHATGALAAERAAFARDRTALEKTLAEHASGLKTATANLKTAGANIRQEAQNATPALQDATKKAVEASMREILTHASTVAANALKTASGPVLERLTVAIQAAGTAEASLKRAGQWFAWKWVALAAGSTAGMLLAAYFVLAVLNSADQAQWVEQHQALVQNIAQLQTTADALEKRTYGLRIVTGSDGTFLIVPKGAQTTQCKAGPCIRLE